MGHVLAMTYYHAFLIPILAATLAYLLNLPFDLGAHPWWSRNVVLIGLPVGLILAALLARVPMSRAVAIVVTAGATIAAYATAVTGKTRFAASYAEDAFAGQMWYFGWIATCALAAAFIATAFWPRRV